MGLWVVLLTIYRLFLHLQDTLILAVIRWLFIVLLITFYIGKQVSKLHRNMLKNILKPLFTSVCCRTSSQFSCNIFWNSIIASVDIILVLNDCCLFLWWLKTIENQILSLLVKKAIDCTRYATWVNSTIVNKHILIAELETLKAILVGKLIDWNRL